MRMILLTPAILLWAALGCASYEGPAAAPTASVPPSPALVDSLDAYLRSAVEASFSGVVLVARGDEILLHESYSADPAVSRDAAFWIGSVTKPLTAAAIMRLQEQGRLRVGDPISRHLPDVPDDKRHISIHHLLTHTSGLGTEYSADGIADRDDALRRILALPLEHEPGTAGYSNDAYSLLAVLIAVVSERPYEEFMADEVLRPAGMSTAGFWGAGPGPGQAEPAPVKRPPSGDVAAPNWGFRGATGVRATAEDLFRWQRALQTRQFLSTFSRDVSFVPHLQFSPDEGYGYGWLIADTNRGTRVLFHNGAESGIEHYASLRRYVDEDVIVVLLSNAPEDLTWETEAGLVDMMWRIGW